MHERATHPMVSGPLDTAPSTPQSRSTSTNNACGRHGCILPKLTPEVNASTNGSRHRCSLSGQSSPGILHDGQQPSYGTRQIPQTSPSPSGSSGSVEPVSQRHCAIACQFFTVTFMVDQRGTRTAPSASGLEKPEEAGGSKLQDAQPSTRASPLRGHLILRRVLVHGRLPGPAVWQPPACRFHHLLHVAAKWRHLH